MVGLRFSPGNEYDNQEVNNLTDGLFGLFVGDAGYILRKKYFSHIDIVYVVLQSSHYGLYRTREEIGGGSRRNMGIYE